MVPSLSQAPLGLSALEDMGDTPVIEIEIEDPEGVRIGLDGMEIDLMPEDKELDFDANLAEEMDLRSVWFITIAFCFFLI
jgi:hypothetical protein